MSGARGAWAGSLVVVAAAQRRLTLEAYVPSSLVVVAVAAQRVSRGDPAATARAGTVLVRRGREAAVVEAEVTEWAEARAVLVERPVHPEPTAVVAKGEPAEVGELRMPGASVELESGRGLVAWAGTGSPRWLGEAVAAVASVGAAVVSRSTEGVEPVEAQVRLAIRALLQVAMAVQVVRREVQVPWLSPTRRIS